MLITSLSNYPVFYCPNGSQSLCEEAFPSAHDFTAQKIEEQCIALPIAYLQVFIVEDILR